MLRTHVLRLSAARYGSGRCIHPLANQRRTIDPFKHSQGSLGSDVEAETSSSSRSSPQRFAPVSTQTSAQTRSAQEVLREKIYVLEKESLAGNIRFHHLKESIESRMTALNSDISTLKVEVAKVSATLTKLAIKVEARFPADDNKFQGLYSKGEAKFTEFLEQQDPMRWLTAFLVAYVVITIVIQVILMKRDSRQRRHEEEK